MQSFNLFFVFALLTVIGAQTSTGPCVGTLCPLPTETCINLKCYTTSTLPACVDVATNCAKLKAGGYCANDKYSSLMITNCAKTCAKCFDSVPIKDSSCVDIASNCASFKVQFDKTKESNLFHLFVTEINELELDPTKNIDGQMPIPRFNHCSIGATSSGDIFMSLVLYGALTRNDEYSEFIARYKSYVHPVNKRKIKIYPLMEISLETDYSIFWTEIVINDVVVDIQNYFKSFREVFRTSRMRTLFEMPRRTHPINKYNVKKKIETIRSSKKL
uniref:ShKT domain-containing protein n=1 Tax=Rhabditophanes sp. KR3021 TaxID=114890 RepID=A0AC35U0U4_9BILA